MYRPEKIISGGQTGSDRAGLDAAIALGIPTGGVAPRHFRTEAGHETVLRDKYGLTESNAYTYPPRTATNIADADVTVIFGNIHSTGSRMTINLCRNMSKPYLTNPSSIELAQFCKAHNCKVLNVAGNRASVNPKVYELTYQTIFHAFNQIALL